MNLIFFSGMIILFVYFNTGLPEPVASLTSTFLKMTDNLKVTKLLDNDLERLCANYIHLMFKHDYDGSRLILHQGIVDYRTESAQLEQFYERICDLALQKDIVYPRIRTIICNQLVGSANFIVMDANEGKYLFWKFFLHVVQVRNQMRIDKDYLVQ